MAKRKTKAEREEFWRLALELQRASGLTVREFCRREQLQEPAFYVWRRKLGMREAGGGRRHPAGPPVDTPGCEASAGNARVGKMPSSKARSAPVGECSSGALFIPVHVLGSGMAGGPERIEILVGRGCIVRVPDRFDGQTLREVLGVLEGQPC